MDVVLIGAGGHAKLLVEMLATSGDRVTGYIDPKKSEWLNAKHLEETYPFEDRGIRIVMGLCGVTPAALERRLAMLGGWIDRGFDTPVLVHPSAVVSKTARIEPGAMVLAQAIVQPGAVIGRGVVVNTGAIVEHDSIIDAGVHVAPGAIVLGGVRVGSCSMIGAGSVVLVGTQVPAGTLVKAQSRYPETASAE